jgi:hypothetical protein
MHGYNPPPPITPRLPVSSNLSHLSIFLSIFHLARLNKFIDRIVKRTQAHAVVGSFYSSAQKPRTHGAQKWLVYGPFETENGEMNQSLFVPPPRRVCPCC